MVTVVVEEMANWRVRDQIRVISFHDQAGKVPWKADFRDRVMRDGKSGCWPSERKRKVDERGLRHLKNECYDGAEQREDYIDMKVEWWWGLVEHHESRYARKRNYFTFDTKTAIRQVRLKPFQDRPVKTRPRETSNYNVINSVKSRWEVKNNNNNNNSICVAP